MKTIQESVSEDIMKMFPNGKVNWEKEMDRTTYNSFLKLAAMYNIPVVSKSKGYVTTNLAKNILLGFIKEFKHMEKTENLYPYFERYQIIDFVWLCICWQNNHPKNFKIGDTYAWKIWAKDFLGRLYRIFVILGLLGIFFAMVGSLFS